MWHFLYLQKHYTHLLHCFFFRCAKLVMIKDLWTTNNLLTITIKANQASQKTDKTSLSTHTCLIWLHSNTIIFRRRFRLTYLYTSSKCLSNKLHRISASVTVLVFNQPWVCKRMFESILFIQHTYWYCSKFPSHENMLCV